MVRRAETHDEAIDQLWTELSRVRTAMLSVLDSGQHPQPMTQFPKRDENAIWFVTSADTDLAQAIASEAPGQMTVISGDQDYHASLRGTLSISRDQNKIDEFWSIATSAWFEDGREDPKIRLIRFDPEEAAIWASDSNLALVGLRLLRASLSDESSKPAIGVHHALTLRAA